MAGGGGKGGSTSTEVTIPPWLQEAAQSNLAKAGEISKIGYTPYYGPDVAAMTPLQNAGMQNTGYAASAFGLPFASDPMAGMPTPQTYAGGLLGYSSGGMYDQARSELAARSPGQYAAVTAPFINPVTGAQPMTPYGTGSAPPVARASTSAPKAKTQQQVWDEAIERRRIAQGNK